MIRRSQEGSDLLRWVPIHPPFSGQFSPVAERWTDLEEMQRQFERREALRAACDGLPDPGYTYPGAHGIPEVR